MSLPVIAILFGAAFTALAWSVQAPLRRIASQLKRRSIDDPASALADLFVFVEPRRILQASGIGAAIALLAVAVLVHSLLAGAVAAAVVFACPRIVQRALRRRRLVRLCQQLPDAVAALAGASRSGAALAQALDRVAARTPAPLGQELALVMRTHRMGVRLEDALRSLETRAPLPEVRLLCAAVALALQVGGSLAPTLERLADTLRRKLGIEDKIRSLTAQGRLQAVIVTALPLVLLLVLSAMDPVAMRPLFSTTAGFVVLAAIAVLETAGWLLIRRIVAIDV
jgi:tight adherence protein B